MTTDPAPLLEKHGWEKQQWQETIQTSQSRRHIVGMMLEHRQLYTECKSSSFKTKHQEKKVNSQIKLHELKYFIQNSGEIDQIFVFCSDVITLWSGQHGP